MSGGLRPGLVWTARTHPERTIQTFWITKEDEEEDLLTLRPQQRTVLEAITQHNLVLVYKYRQAYISTLAWAWLLQQVEYTPGIKGIFMADTKETAEDVFRNAINAYDRQPKAIRIPAKRSGAKGIEFQHRGILQVKTAGKRVPGIGSSIDRAVFTEFGFWQSQEHVVANVFPAFEKRPNARILGESTPGAHGSAYHRMVMKNWNNPRAKWHVVFLAWWLDATCTRPVPYGFTRTLEEHRLAEKMRGITDAHLMFRRDLLENTFLGDTNLFNNKYPPSITEGWRTTGQPALPQDILTALLTDAIDDPSELGQVTGADWIRGETYLLVADPNSYGTTGDPSAVSLFLVRTGEEVFGWSSRIDPIVLSDWLAKIGRLHGDATVAVESNAAACITALVLTGYRNIYFNADNTDSHPGWYATSVDIDRAHGSLVKGLREGWIRPRSRQGIQQMLAYDGKGFTRSRQEDGTTHHWDRVRVYVIAADLLEHQRERLLRQQVRVTNNAITWEEAKKMHRQPKGPRA